MAEKRGGREEECVGEGGESPGEEEDLAEVQTEYRQENRRLDVQEFEEVVPRGFYRVSIINCTYDDLQGVSITVMNSSVDTFVLNKCNVPTTSVLPLMLLYTLTLRVLDLSDNTIDSKGAQQLAEALKLNTTLEELHLEKNPIREVGVQALVLCLERNFLLKKLTVDRCGNAGLEGRMAALLERNVNQARKPSGKSVSFTQAGSAARRIRNLLNDSSTGLPQLPHLSYSEPSIGSCSLSLTDREEEKTAEEEAKPSLELMPATAVRLETNSATGGPRVRQQTACATVYVGRMARTEVAATEVQEAHYEGTAAEEWAREQADVWAGLRHPNIAQFFGVWESGRVRYLVGEAAADTVAEVLGGEGADFAEECDLLARIYCCLDVAYALRELHRKGVYHGDVCADNVYILRQPGGAYACKLAGMAVAAKFGSCPSFAVTEKRRPHCLAPEVLLENAHGPGGDVWALAVLVLQLWCARADVPFHGLSDARVRMELLSDYGARPRAPDEMDGGLSECLTRCWRNRGEGRAALDDLIAALSALATKLEARRSLEQRKASRRSH